MYSICSFLTQHCCDTTHIGSRRQQQRSRCNMRTTANLLRAITSVVLQCVATVGVRPVVTGVSHATFIVKAFGSGGRRQRQEKEGAHHCCVMAKFLNTKGQKLKKKNTLLHELPIYQPATSHKTQNKRSHNQRTTTKYQDGGTTKVSDQQ